MNPGDYVCYKTAERFWFGWVTGWIGEQVTVQKLDYRHPSGWATVLVDPADLTVVSATPVGVVLKERVYERA